MIRRLGVLVLADGGAVGRGTGAAGHAGSTPPSRAQVLKLMSAMGVQQSVDSSLQSAQNQLKLAARNAFLKKNPEADAATLKKLDEVFDSTQLFSFEDSFRGADSGVPEESERRGRAGGNRFLLLRGWKTAAGKVAGDHSRGQRERRTTGAEKLEAYSEELERKLKAFQAELDRRSRRRSRCRPTTSRQTTEHEDV